MKRISLVIPMYNVEKFLGRCLDSCLEQDIPADDYEIIAVDDESPDNSRKIAEEYASRHSCIKVIRQKHAGLSAARNLGLRTAEGSYVWFIDSDDWIERDSLGAILHLCESQGLDILRICGENVHEDRSERRFSIGDTSVRPGWTMIDDSKLQLCAPFSIYRRTFLIYNNLKFIRGIYHEDAEFTPRAYYHAGKVGALDQVLYFVQQNEGSITRSYNPQRSLDYLEVVIPSLSEFSKTVQEDCKPGFDNLISSNFSNALKNSLGLDKADRTALDACAYERRKYLKHLRRSKVFKYKVEGLVLSLFPRHMTAAYRAMKTLV
ncbi:MAG: glycosyltransferase [Bacteroidales bacterium]|nr:glycosyltransferase [Candidatus Cryptobacteroides faecihippi]